MRCCLISILYIANMLTSSAQDFWVKTGLDSVEVHQVIAGPGNTVYALVQKWSPWIHTELFRSTDGGVSWGISTAGLPPGFQSQGIFTDSSAFTYLTINDSLYGIQSGDTAWSMMPAPGSWILSGLSNSGGLILLGAVYIFRSTDHGASWDTVYDNRDGETNVWAFAISKSGNILASGDAWRAPTWMVRSGDQGITWFPTVFYYHTIEEMVASPSGSILGINDWGDLVRSTDDGDTWTIRDTSQNGRYYASILFDNDGILYATASDKILSSVNEGLDWVDITGNLRGGAGTLALGADGHLLLGRGDGVWRTADKITAVEEPGHSTYPSNFALHQNYPNPFNPATTIEYDLPGNADVTLKVFNVAGEEMKTLVNRFEPPGRKSVRWDAGDLPSGVYFYRLQAGRDISVKPMILMR